MQNFDDTITLEVKSRLDDLFGETVHSESALMETRRQNAAPLNDLKSAVLSIDWEITESVMNDLLKQTELLMRRYAGDRIVTLFLQILGSVGKYVQVNKNKSHPEAFRILNTVFGRLEEVVTSPDLKESQKKRYLYAEIVKFKKLKQKIALERSRPVAGQAPPAEPREKGETMPLTGSRGEADRVLPEAAPELREPERFAENENEALFVEPVVEALPADGESGDRRRAGVEPNLPPSAPDDRMAASALPPAGSTPDTLVTALDEIKQLIRHEFESLRAELRLLTRNRF